jgi:hypothetical protein
MVEIMQLSAVMPPLNNDVNHRSDRPAANHRTAKQTAHYRANSASIRNGVINVQPKVGAQNAKMEKVT